MTEIEKRTGMTDAECEYWDDYFTNNPYLCVQAEKFHKSPIAAFFE